MRWLLSEGYRRPDGSVRQDWRAYILALVLVDAAAAVGALALSYYVRFAVARDAFAPSSVSLDRYIALGAVVLVAWLVTIRALGLYEREQLLAGTDEYARVVQASTLVLVGVVLADFVVESNVVSRAWLFLFWADLAALAGLARFVMRRVAFVARRWGAFRSRVVIVGADDRAVELAHHLEGPEFEVLGFLDDFRPAGAQLGGNGWRVLGSASQLDRLDQLDVDEIIVAPLAISWESRQAIIHSPERRRFDVCLLATREGTLTTGVRVSHRVHVPVYAFEPARLVGWEAGMKRSFDIAVALVLLGIAGPLAALRVVTCLVRRQPPLEPHRILGRNGDPITVHSLSGNGNRVLSKLPAAINVLRGQMSIVGPPPVEEGQEVSSPELRLMRPGLTSVVPADRGPLDHESALSIQLDYVRNYSIWRDLQVAWHRVVSARPGGGGKRANGTTLWGLMEGSVEQLKQEP